MINLFNFYVVIYLYIYYLILLDPRNSAYKFKEETSCINLKNNNNIIYLFCFVLLLFLKIKLQQNNNTTNTRRSHAKIIKNSLSKYYSKIDLT